MSNEALTEAIAKAIFVGYLKDFYQRDSQVEWADSEACLGSKRYAREAAATVMACPEMIAALAPPAPRIVDTVEEAWAMPERSVLRDRCGGVLVTPDEGVGLDEGVGAFLRDLAPFTVLHVGSAV